MLSSFISASSGNPDFIGFSEKYRGKDFVMDEFDKGSFYKDLLAFREEENHVNMEDKETVLSIGEMRLFHYRSKGVKKGSAPLLIVSSLINRQYMMDLQPDRSVIKKFVDGGLDVYLIDWGYPTSKDLYISTEDYINGYMDTCVDCVLRLTGYEKLNIIGVCLGGTFSVIYTSLHQDKVKNLIAMVVPVDFDAADAILFRWCKKVDVPHLVDASGVVSGEFLNYMFLYFKPYELNVDKYVKLLKDHGKDKMPAFLKMERWVFDCPGESGAMLSDCMDGLFSRNLLVKGRFRLGDAVVDTKKVTCPVLCVCGKKDHIVPLSTSKPLFDIIGSTDKETAAFDCGHIGMYVSTSSQNLVSPKILDWIFHH